VKGFCQKWKFNQEKTLVLLQDKGFDVKVLLKGNGLANK
jgi:hypothetical protein